jgi:hypothetical protein
MRCGFPIYRLYETRLRSVSHSYAAMSTFPAVARSGLTAGSSNSLAVDYQQWTSGEIPQDKHETPL